MNSPGINFSTGPVNISKEVQMALAAPAVSHRSAEFRKLYYSTTEFLCEQFNTKNAFLITGSGTAANEAMIWQIKMFGGKGLILSNGEFGSRLIEQARHASLQFIEYSLTFGGLFDIEKIEPCLRQNEISWLLFCHCETSTGVINDLDLLSGLCAKNNCHCFVDCMSTAGANAVDLSRITMATASSGKGLASLPGLAIILSNTAFAVSANIPLYLDLNHYSLKDGIPFTISSNLVYALRVSIKQKFQQEQFALTDHYSNECFRLLSKSNVLPFSNEHAKVFTISADNKIPDFVEALKMKNIIISCESDYLKKRHLCQLAFFGYHQQAGFEKLLMALKETILISAA